jgi:hypothetical protein
MNDVSCQLKHTYRRKVISQKWKCLAFRAQTHMDNRMRTIYVYMYDVRRREGYGYSLIRIERKKRERERFGKQTNKLFVCS